MLASLVLAFQFFAISAIIGGVAMTAVGFGLLALWFGGYPFGFNPLLGIAGLIGLAINDSIVVLAAIREKAAAAAGEIAAVASAALSWGRHVLGTTLTTIGGFLPLLLGGGDFWPPLGSGHRWWCRWRNALALVFVPAGYVQLVRWGLVRTPASITERDSLISGDLHAVRYENNSNSFS